MSHDGLLADLPPLVGDFDSPPASGARVTEASGGVAAARDSDHDKRGGGEVELETITAPSDIFPKSEYEGKRSALFTDFDKEAKKADSKSVVFMKPSPTSAARLTRVTWLQKPTCSKYCLSVLSTKGGLPKFCMQELEDGKCSLKTHADKPKFDPEDGLYVMSETTAGRGGMAAYSTKFLAADLFEERDQIDAVVTKEMTVKEWDEFMRSFKMARTTGNEVKDMDPSQVTSSVKILQACYTPQKVPKSREVESDTTILDTPDSWEEVFTTNSLGDALGDPLAELPRDPTSVSTLVKFANKGFGICNDNFNMVSDSMDSLGGKARNTFGEIFAKLNKLTIVLQSMQDQIGSYCEIEGTEGIATLFESLVVLDSKIGFNSRAIVDVDDQLQLIKGRVDSIDLSKGDFDQGLEKVEQSSKNFDKRLTMAEGDVESAILTQKKMITTYLRPLISFFNELKTKDMSGCDFVERVARMEQTVHRLGNENDLFGNISMTGFGCGAAGEDLATTLNRLAVVESENVYLRKELEEIKENLKATSPGGGGQDLGKLGEDIIERVTVLEEYRGPGIVIAGIRFDGPGSCEQFLRSQLAWDNNKPFFGNDWVSLVHSIPKEDGAVTIEALMARDHHTTKGGFSNLSAAKAYASAQQSVPGMLAGTAEHPIPGVKTYDKYDHQDGLKGIRYEITRGVDHRGSALMSLMQRDLRTSPTALTVFTSLVLNAQIHWKTFAAFLSDLRHVTYHQCHDAAEAWLYACEVGRGVFDECFKLRNVGSERSNMKEFTVQDAARLMWGMVQTQDLMDEFIKYKFLGHPNLASYSINHLFRNRVTPNNISGMKGELQKVVSKVSALENTLDKVNSKLASLGRKKGE